jgi:hypothetical protein
MEPLKPEVKRFVLENNPQASPEEMEEYERLLAERFTRDPDVAASPTAEAASASEERLNHLYQKLFGFLNEPA